MTTGLPHRRGDEAIDTIAGLCDPLRRRLYQLVADHPGPVGRDELAEATGAKRGLVAYHLDRLVDDGLLEVSYARRTGRAGPGAGRPAKLYRPADVEVTVQLPARDDTLVAHLLATAIETERTGAARRALRRATRAAGRRLGKALHARTVDELVGELGERGYAPVVEPDGIRLRNCPFHHLVGDHLELVCHLNHDLLSAAIDQTGIGLVAELDPQPGSCCVRFRSANRG